MGTSSLGNMITQAVYTDTVAGWLWYCDVCDTHGNGDSRQEVAYVSDAHVEFRDSISDAGGEHDITIWMAGADAPWEPPQRPSMKRDWQVVMYSNPQTTHRRRSFKNEDEGLAVAYDFVREAGVSASALVITRRPTWSRVSTRQMCSGGVVSWLPRSTHQRALRRCALACRRQCSASSARCSASPNGKASGSTLASSGWWMGTSLDGAPRKPLGELTCEGLAQSTWA